MDNKRGLEMAMTTVIMIVLSIAALTVILVFFNSQTGFFSKFFEGQKQESNVDLFISNCNSLAVRDSTYSYCCEEKEVRFGEGKDKGEFTCGSAFKLEWSGKRIDELDCSAVSCV